MTTAAAGALLFAIAVLASSIDNAQGQKRRSSPPTASQVVDFDCPEEFGYYAHPADCTQYYVCVFGGALLESCTGGLMYSHELQTCDWPRNVGCGEPSQPSNPPPQQTEVRVSRPSQVSSRGSQQSREQQHVPKHDLYTEEELGPAEEIESDRQQRVYRGQPPTIGQVASDRDAIAHSNAIPVQSSGGREKLSVVSYGGQQQYSRASVAPQQAYVESVTAAPRPFNASQQQYIAQQYDPYYSIYDEEDLYKDIDYSQYTTNQGSQGRYRAQPAYKERKPTVEIIQQDPVQRGSTYAKTKYNTQQDLFQPSVTQQDYESYSIQTNDDIQYRQPIQTKSSNRLALSRGSEGSSASKEEKVAALPEGVERNDSVGGLAVRPPSPARPDPLPPQPLRTQTETPRQTKETDRKQQTDRTVEKQRHPFVIQITSPATTSPEDEALQRKSYEIIKSFLEEQRKSGQAPRPFRPRSETKEPAERKKAQTNPPRSQFVVPTIDIVEQTVRFSPPRTTQKTFTPRDRQTDEATKNIINRVPYYTEDNRNSSRLRPVIVEDYSITSKPLLTRNESPKTTPRGYLDPSSEDLSYRRTTPPSQFRLGTLVEDYTITTLRPSSKYVLEQINIRRTSTARPEKTTETPRYSYNKEEIDEFVRRKLAERVQKESENYQNERKPQLVTETKPSRLYDTDSYSADQYGPPRAKISQKPFVKPATQSQSNYYTREPTLERQTKYDTDYRNFKLNLATEPNSRLSDFTHSNDIDGRSFDLAPPKIQCTSNCTDKQILRVRPTAYDTQATPGITRGSTRHRGGLTYTVSPNEAEPAPIHRGTPAVSRVRPTLRPANTVVSKAAEFVDIYRYPPRRPDPVYPTPQVDKTAAKCRKDVCLLPDCYCGGKDIPGDLSPEETPQIVLLTFDDSVNDLNKGLYSDLFEKGRTNPNGCPIAATFYVSHEWTDYSQVQNLYAAGHEIASHSVSHSFGEQFTQRKWTREIAGQREILAAYGGVKQEDIRGMRAPFLAVGGNKMFKMLYDSNFTYDSSMPVYENKPPSWPYTMDYKIFHDCMIPPCPTRSYPGVWEVPMVMWQDLNGGRCSMGDACSNPPTADGVYKMLIKNFERHFTSNRAPFGLFYHAAWFTQPHHKEGFIAFLDTITNMPEVWLVTNWQAIQWVRDPTPISRLNSFAPFHCNYPDRPKKCNNPKVCNLWHKSGVRYMRTCQACPEVYPWTGKSGVRNSRVDNEIIEE